MGRCLWGDGIRFTSNTAIIGLGFDEFSVSSPQVPAVKYALRKLNFRDCKEMAQGAIKCGDQEEVLDVCRKIAITTYPEIIN